MIFDKAILQKKKFHGTVDQIINAQQADYGVNKQHISPNRLIGSGSDNVPSHIAAVSAMTTSNSVMN